MKALVMVNHLVKNYQDWRPKFDNDEAMRQQMGIRLINVLSHTENENDITIVFETSDFEQFKTLVASPELKANMQEAGVVSEPVIKVYFSKN